MSYSRLFKRVNLVLFQWCVCGVIAFGIAAEPIAEGSKKFLGNICSGTPSTAFGDYWNQITLENHGKWGLVQPTDTDSFNWAATDAAYAYCKTKGWPYKHHCFVWGQQQPRWINNLLPEEQKAAVEKYIRTFGERYPETDFIDVVNEPINAPAAYREALGGSGETGWDWVITVFELARKYCPGAKLLINEYDIENNPAKAVLYRGIVTILQSKNLIDGIGIQSHCFNIENTPVATVRFCLDTLASTGLPLYASEFDLTGDEATQLERYQTYFPIFWEHPAIKGVTLWGWTSNWKGAIIMSGGREYAALSWMRTYVDSLENYGATVRNQKGPAEKPFHPLMVSRSGSSFIRLNVPGAAGRITLRMVDPAGRTVYASPVLCEKGVAAIPAPFLGRGVYAMAVTYGNARLRSTLVLK